jgi:peptidoglycan/xylan/chitin deacetylase (PgdA/CDA1 family)
VEFGGHTQHHVNLTAEDSAVRRAELSGSKHAIERECGAQATTFSYPYGMWNEESRRDVIDAGYDCAVTSRRSLVTAGCDLYAIPRLGFDPRPFYMACELLLHHVKLHLRPMVRPSARTPSTTHATIG